MSSINLPHPEAAAKQPSRRSRRRHAAAPHGEGTHDAEPSHGSSVPARFAKLDSTLAWITEVPAAILVVVEIAVLFLWLAMFGAVIALRRGEHMRLTALVKLATPRRQAFLETLAAIVVAVFVLQIILPAYDYVESEWLITTPALAIPDGLRVAAIGVGAVLMLVIALARLVEFATPREFVLALAIAAAVALVLFLAKPALLALGNYNLVVFFVLLVAACIAIGVP